MANRKIEVGSLEFDQIKENLKNFLSGQEQFSDYDFEGSNLSILLDVLAYNTYYNNIYTNLAINEAYLDTASKRNSVVSLAKQLGYTPRSAYCARTKVSFVVTNVSGDEDFITMPKYTTFSGIKDSLRYIFYTKENVTAAKNINDEYEFEDVELVEGLPIINKFAYTTANSFIIPNPNIDISTLSVRVQVPPSSDYSVYNRAELLSDISATSKVFFLTEKNDNLYEISFGDDIFGKQLNSGDIIYTEYFVSSGNAPNGIKAISYSGQNLLGGTVEGLTITETVHSGREKETINEIKFNAPNYYGSQNRMVTAQDYESILLSKVSSVDDVIVWGGETLSSPIYGKVFISAKTPSGGNLTFSERENITLNVINKYKLLTVIPEFVTPEYIQVEMDVVAYYDPALTIKSSNDIKTLVTLSIEDHNNSELKKFNKVLRTSSISRLVESADISIISCTPRFKMFRTITPLYSINHKYTIALGNPITPGSIESNQFNIEDYDNSCLLKDAGQGIIYLYAIINGIKTQIKQTGTVDYTKGLIIIDNLKITSIAEDLFKIGMSPSSSDIASLYNQIVSIDMSKLKVSIVVDDSSEGRSLKGNSYNFSSITLS